jgi:hypothetical protein
MTKALSGLLFLLVLSRVNDLLMLFRNYFKTIDLKKRHQRFLNPTASVWWTKKPGGNPPRVDPNSGCLALATLPAAPGPGSGFLAPRC